MEDVIINYIKDMFGSNRPTWTSEYEGVLMYDKEAHVWIGADDIGWVEIKILGD